ncbi:MAG TPA: type I phosphomannose isomerase catalytic subunit [Catenuloplanes sp.]|jgi:mannose-6-phosphate isomerase
MDWYPLRLSAAVRGHVFGGRVLADRWGRTGLPAGRVAETWEVSDVDGEIAEVRSGPLAGRTLRQLVEDHPKELMGDGWSGPHFPLLTKFIDGSNMLPVHLHPDDATARALHGQPNGKTEAWHVLDAAPGATALLGVRDGVDEDRLRRAFLRGDFDAVLRRLPVHAGQTVYVPAGTLHSFGPDTLVYEVEQTSDLQQHAMCWRMQDGSQLTGQEWHANLDALVREWKPEHRPDFQAGATIRVAHDVERLICCAGPYFALERWRVGSDTPLRYPFDTAVIVTNVSGPVSLAGVGWSEVLGPARTLLLPAALGEVVVTGPADLMVSYLPDLDRDIRAPLIAAGYGPAAIAMLGEGLG